MLFRNAGRRKNKSVHSISVWETLLQSPRRGDPRELRHATDRGADGGGPPRARRAVVEIAAISHIMKEQMNEVIDTVREALSARLEGRALADDGGLHEAQPRAAGPLRRAPAASHPHVLGAGLRDMEELRVALTEFSTFWRLCYTQNRRLIKKAKKTLIYTQSTASVPTIDELVMTFDQLTFVRKEFLSMFNDIHARRSRTGRTSSARSTATLQVPDVWAGAQHGRARVEGRRDGDVPQCPGLPLRALLRLPARPLLADLLHPAVPGGPADHRATTAGTSPSSPSRCSTASSRRALTFDYTHSSSPSMSFTRSKPSPRIRSRCSLRSSGMTRSSRAESTAARSSRSSRWPRHSTRSRASSRTSS